MNWVFITIIAIVFGTLYDLATKGALSKQGAGDFGNVLFNLFLVQAMVLFGYQRISTGTFAIKDINKDKKVDYHDILIIVWTGIIFLLYMILVTKSIDMAPNIGYAKAVDTFGVVSTTILSYYLFGRK